MSDWKPTDGDEEEIERIKKSLEESVKDSMFPTDIFETYRKSRIHELYTDAIMHSISNAFMIRIPIYEIENLGIEIHEDVDPEEEEMQLVGMAPVETIYRTGYVDVLKGIPCDYILTDDMPDTEIEVRGFQSSARIVNLGEGDAESV